MDSSRSYSSEEAVKIDNFVACNLIPAMNSLPEVLVSSKVQPLLSSKLLFSFPLLLPLLEATLLVPSKLVQKTLMLAFLKLL